MALNLQKKETVLRPESSILYTEKEIRILEHLASTELNLSKKEWSAVPVRIRGAVMARISRNEFARAMLKLGISLTFRSGPGAGNIITNQVLFEQLLYDKKLKKDSFEAMGYDMLLRTDDKHKIVTQVRWRSEKFSSTYLKLNNRDITIENTRLQFGGHIFLLGYGPTPFDLREVAILEFDSLQDSNFSIKKAKGNRNRVDIVNVRPQWRQVFVKMWSMQKQSEKDRFLGDIHKAMEMI